MMETASAWLADRIASNWGAFISAAAASLSCVVFLFFIIPRLPRTLEGAGYFLLFMSAAAVAGSFGGWGSVGLVWIGQQCQQFGILWILIYVALRLHGKVPQWPRRQVIDEKEKTNGR